MRSTADTRVLVEKRPAAEIPQATRQRNAVQLDADGPQLSSAGAGLTTGARSGRDAYCGAQVHLGALNLSDNRRAFERRSRIWNKRRGFGVINRGTSPRAPRAARRASPTAHGSVPNSPSCVSCKKPARAARPTRQSTTWSARWV